MSVAIDNMKCVGCGRCSLVCPGNLIILCGDSGERKARIRDPKDCWSCASCVKECPVDAIALVLPLELGGKGGRLNVEEDGSIKYWTYTGRDGTFVKMMTDAAEANKY